MTEQNLTFSIEIDFIPDMKEGRTSFQETMKKQRPNTAAPTCWIRTSAPL